MPKRKGCTPRRDLYVKLRQDGKKVGEIADQCGVAYSSVSSALSAARAAGTSVRMAAPNRFIGDRRARLHVTPCTRKHLDARAEIHGMTAHDLADKILSRIARSERLVAAFLNPEHGANT